MCRGILGGVAVALCSAVTELSMDADVGSLRDHNDRKRLLAAFGSAEAPYARYMRGVGVVVA